MEIISKNLKFLRRQKNMTQQAFADWIGIKRSSLGAYEEGRAKPGFNTISQISNLFGISIDQLVKNDLTQIAGELVRDQEISGPTDIKGNRLRVLSITVDRQDKEYIDLVPQKAAAGYTTGYADPEFVQELPRFNLPNLPSGSYRAFEITGDSMMPLQPGSIVIGEYVEDWHQVHDSQTYIVVSEKDGIVYKRVYNKIAENSELILQSDNPSYQPYSISIEDVLEIWQAKAYISTVFPDNDMNMEKLMHIVMDLQQEVIRLKKN